jgi:DNA-binding response OmpR family regulator
VDQLVGLEIGADDYITKPFSPRVVVSKVKAVLRRSNKKVTPHQILRVDDIVIDLDAHTVTRGTDMIHLTPTEFDLLSTLADQPGRAFSRLQLLEATQGTAYEGYERTIDAHIKNLRAKIETDPKEPHYIETVFGIGYRFTKL